MEKKEYKYDVVLSFAGEDRIYVQEVTDSLIANEVKVFYDKFEEDKLWGKDLYVYLDNIYRKEAKFCVMFLSQHYAKKLWTNHERESAQARAFQQNEEYILPIKLDDTEIPGIRATTGYLDGRKKTPKEICELILKKLKLEKLDTKIIDNDGSIQLPKIKRKITDLEKSKFLKSSFNELKTYFRKGLEELKNSYSNVETEFEENKSSKFSTSVYVDGALKSKCKIWIGGLWGNENSISYSEGIRGWDDDDHSLNDTASVKDDGSEIYFEILGMYSGKIEGTAEIDLKHASAKELAKYYWARFINYLR